MNFIRNFFSGLFSFFLVIFLVLFIILLSFNNVFLTKEVFLQTLEKNKTYDKIATEVLPNLILGSILKTEGNSPVSSSDVDKIVAGIDKTKMMVVEVEIKKLFENAYLFVLGQQSSFEQKIELAANIASIKDSLTASVQTLNQSGQVTTVKPEQIAQALSTNQNYTLILTQDKLAIVSPGGEKLESNNTQVKNQFSLLKLRDAVVKVKQTQSLLLGLTIFMIIILFASRLPNLVEGLKWCAGAFFSAGIFPLIISFILLYTKPVGYIERFIANHPEISIPKALVALASTNAADLLNSFLENLRLYSLILVVSAGAIYALIWIVRLLKNQARPRPLDTQPLKT